MHLEKQVLERRQLEEELEIGEEAQVDELAWMIGSSPQQLRYSTDSHSLIQLPPNPISLRILIYIAQDGDDDGDEDPGLEWWRWW